jgi:hypothetical protein
MNIKMQTVFPVGTVINKVPRGKAAGIPPVYCKTSLKSKSRAAVAAVKQTERVVSLMLQADAHAAKVARKAESETEAQEIDRAFNFLMLQFS